MSTEDKNYRASYSWINCYCGFIALLGRKAKVPFPLSFPINIKPNVQCKWAGECSYSHSMKARSCCMLSCYLIS